MIQTCRVNLTGDDFAGGFSLELGPEEAVPASVTFRDVVDVPEPHFGTTDEGGQQAEDCSFKVWVYAGDEDRLRRMVDAIKRLLQKPIPATDPARGMIGCDRGGTFYHREPYRGKVGQIILSAEIHYTASFATGEGT